MITREQIEACIDPGVVERPPVVGKQYAAFVVHPHSPGPLYALAIAHRDGETLVLDVIREDISVDDSVDLMKRYGIDHVTGAVGDPSDALVHAVAGVTSLLADKGVRYDA